MSAGNFKVSYSALAQIALLPLKDKAALALLFSSDEINQTATTRANPDGRFVSKLGNKRVLWQRTAEQQPEIISIIDKSYA